MKLHRPKLKEIRIRVRVLLPLLFWWLGNDRKHVAVSTDGSEIMQNTTSFHQY